MNTKATWGGQRKGAGRPSRSEPKSKPIWCGQLTDAERDLILKTLTADERGQVLLHAVEEKQHANQHL